MTISASAVARVVGIDTQFKDLRGGNVQALPQRIALFAQGQSGVSFSTDKWTATGAAAAGSKYGFRSPIYLALRELLPVNGDGVGSVAIDVFPLEDHASGAPAVGDITPSGTATKAASYRVRVSGYLSEAFTLAAGALSTAALLTAACKAMGEAIDAVLHMPVNVTYDYGTVTSAADAGNTGDGTLGTFTTTGNPKPGVWTLVCTAEAANAGTFTLTDPDGVVISTTVTIGAQVQGGLGFTLADGAEDFDTGDSFEITVPATAVNLTSAWDGASANDLVIEVLDDLGELTFAITQPTGGLNNPTVDAALALVGNVWETMALNALNIDDEVALDAFQTWGEGRWGELVRKPLAGVFVGNTATELAAATAISSTRRDDRVNAQLVAPGSPNLPFVVAARQLARIAKLANTNPPHDYGSQRATGLIPGADGEQWDWPTRDLAVKAGSSTIEVKDGVVNIGDVVTFYRPVGEEPPAYRYVCDIVKLQNIIFNLDLLFAVPEWDGAPLIPDDQPTVNPAAKKPKSAKALVAGMLDSLGLNAIISDPKTAKQSITANINGANPKRLDLTVTVQLAGNTNLIPITLNFGFFFGSAAAA